MRMALSPKAVRKQLQLIKPIAGGLSLKTLRRAQNAIGEIMESKSRARVILKNHKFDSFEAAWVIPKDMRREGVILYLHGGGYTCGGLEYATGFGSTLAVEHGARVFCPAYRLAPEYPYPAALDDSIEAYSYLLEKGYSPDHITLCGESAGGGLALALCMRLRDASLPMPAGIIALSPWTDLTMSGDSYEKNKERDPSMTIDALRFFASSYTENFEDPMVSPIFGNLDGMPPALVFSGEDEIMLSDAKSLCEKLKASGCDCRHIIKKERWHAYLLYSLAEDRRDHAYIGKFLNKVMSKENKLRWMPLDNAAKIYPAARSQRWSNVFRLSATLREDVDVQVLRSALDVTARRFPSMAVKLKKGFFWYYLEQLADAPEIMEEQSYPLTKMSKKETRRCAIRVIAYKSRIAIEIFHSLTDGNGGLVFLKTLVAEYLHQKYGIRIPAKNGVLARLDEPTDGELEDSFGKYAAPIQASRKENTAWHTYGTPEEKGHLNVTCLKLSCDEVLNKAHEYKVSVNTFLVSVMMLSLQEMQAKEVPVVKNRKPIKILVPVNLRKLFESTSLRNFALYTTPEILPALGEYSFGEICKVVDSWVKADATPKQMSMKIATNVNSEKNMIVRVMPLFVKNLVMKTIFSLVGERKSCLTLSNLGAVEIPKEMEEYVERFDFILGVQATAPYNCGVISYKDTVYVNFIRNIKESDLEYLFFKNLQSLGISAVAESNAKE